MSDSSNVNPVAVVVVLALAGGIAWCALSPNKPSASVVTSPPAPAAAAAAPSDSLAPGAIVAVPGLASGNAMVLPSKADFLEMRKLLVAGDKTGVLALVNANGFIVTGRPDARVLEYDAWNRGVRIRLIGGAFDARDGWTVRESVAAK